MKELTKRYEKHFGDNIKKVLDSIQDRDPKGEYTLIISGNEKDKNNFLIRNQNLIIDLNDLIMAGLSHSAAANYLSKKSGRPKNEIYNLIIESKL